MKCQVCGEKAVISTSNGTFCSKHFIENFEKIALNTIKEYNLISNDDIIAVANSGGKDSLSLLYFLSKYYDKNKIISITIDEGIPGYRDKTIENVKFYAEKWGIKYYIFSYKEYFGKQLSEIVKTIKVIPCEICGTFRRYLLNHAAKEIGATKLATAHNLDDEVESILMNFIQNNLEQLARLGPKSGLIYDEMFIPRIKPFIFIHEKETMLYALLNGINALHTPCPYTRFGIRHIISEKIKEIEDQYPGAKANVMRNFLNFKEKIKVNKSIKHCKICGYPSSSDICEACMFKQMINEHAIHSL